MIVKASLLTVMALLNAGLSKAGDYTETNNMPVQIRNLMNSEGYFINQKYFNFPKQNSDLHRTLQCIGKQRFIHLELKPKKAAWSLWHNSHFKYVRRNSDQVSVDDSDAAPAKYEYYITYWFDF
jgi:hypothetical protein